MALSRLIYVSRPFGFGEGILNSILLVSRHNNERDDITGALICRGDIYLQWLEGPEPAVAQAYTRIRRDDRHIEIRQLLAGTVTERLFPGWAMRDDPARSWMWTQAEVDQGAAVNATPAEVLAVFERLAAEPG